MKGSLTARITGEHVALALVFFTTFQAVFLQPDETLVPGERTNLFTATCCAFSLAAVWFFLERGPRRSREFVVSVALIGVGVLAALASDATLPSLFRVYAVLASALGGFWCGRKLLATPDRARVFAWYCSALLAGLLVWCLVSVAVTGRIHSLIVGARSHSLVNTIMLLSFAPLALLSERRLKSTLVGAALLLMGYVVLFYSRLRSAVLMPPVLACVGAACGCLKPRHFLLLLLAFLLVAVGFFHVFPKKWKRITHAAHEEVYYRVESYPFALSLALEHPLTGVGLRAPRDAYVDAYTPLMPQIDKRVFRESLQKIVTSENIFLSFLSGLGFPFFLLYTGSLAWLLWRCLAAVRGRPPRPALPAMALFLPLCAGVVYSMFYDSLFYPQVSWFFHLLLGMIPSRATPGHGEPPFEPGI